MTTSLPALVDAMAMAEMLGVPRDSLYELALDGKIKGAYRFGNRWRFDPAEVLAGARVDGPALKPPIFPLRSRD